MKRKQGLLKKAMVRERSLGVTAHIFGSLLRSTAVQELSILCDCEVAIMIFNQQDKLFEYASRFRCKLDAAPLLASARSCVARQWLIVCSSFLQAVISKQFSGSHAACIAGFLCFIPAISR